MRIAIIGGGISGLACAFGLDRQHDLTLFEAADWLGGHTHTVDVDCGENRYAVDTGFIVFNDRTYPNFIRLLGRLGLEGQLTDMSFSVARGRLEYASHSLRGLFANPACLISPGHLRMLRDILRFNERSRELINSADERTLGEYVAGGDYSQRFAELYLYPLCAAIWSSSIADARDFPAEHFVRFFNNHGLLQLRERPPWRVVPGGSRSYVSAIERRCKAQFRLESPVSRVRRQADGVTIESRHGSETFDRVIFACHSDQALRLLADPSEREQEILGGLPYTDNDVVLHTDARILPRRRAAWASWNYRIGDDPAQPAAITYDMNRLQGLSAPEQFCVTLNQQEQIDPAKIIETYVYAHPVFNPQSNRARARRDEINGHNRSHYCGAYWYNGFHEDGARSALDVARSLGGGW